MSKLSAPVKSLISLRGSALGTSSTSHARLLSLLDHLQASSGLSSGSKTTLLTLGAGTFFALNSPAGLRTLWSWSGKAKASATLLLEAGLKSISFIGIAKVINNLGVLSQTIQEDGVLAELPRDARRRTTPENVEEAFSRGRSLWNSIYVPHSDKLVSKLSTYHPDLPVHILESHYSLLLSDPTPFGPLGRTLTSVLAVACLQGQTGVGSQVTSHVFGLKKALEESKEASPTEGLSAEERAWLCGDEGNEWLLKAIEALRNEVQTAAQEALDSTPIRKARL